jgi:alpha-1,3-rhamnosyl/mannosyltransferase
MLRVLVPALQVGPGQTGVGTYTLELVRALTRLPQGEDPDEFVVAAPHPESFGFLQGRRGFQVEPLPLWREDSWGRMLALHTAVPRMAERLGVDLVMGVNFLAPLWGRFAASVVVHDLTFVHFPETMPPAKRIYYRMTVRRSIRRARIVFVTTDCMRRELLAFEPTARGRIRIAPGGVSPTYLATGDADEDGRDRLTRRPRQHFLFVGTLEPRKNLERLVAAHGGLCRFDPDFPALRVVGGQGWEDAGIRRTIRDHPDPSRLHILGYCPPEDLRREYDEALALVFPSLYEGFGLPAVEAMARGCPVLTSRGIATAEVAGEAALLVDPLDGADLERGLRRLACDVDLRRRLSEAGRSRVREFTWERCARSVREAVHEALISSAPGNWKGRR